MSLPIPKYSDEYIDSVRDRFPELQNHTKPELLSVLERNEKRDPYEYEHQIMNALHEIEQEVILEADEKLTDYIFGDMSHEHSDRIQSGINYIVQNSGRGDLVLGSRLKDKAQGWNTTVGAPAFSEDFNFISSSPDKDYLKNGEKNKLLLVLGVYKTGATDTLGRSKYNLVPKLVEIPAVSSMVMKGMMFQKDLDPNEFQENFEKIQA